MLEGFSHKRLLVLDDAPISFAKLVIASTDDVQEILDTEKTALETQLADEGDVSVLFYTNSPWKYGQF